MLDDGIARVAGLAPAAQLAALQGVLQRVTGLRQGLSAALASVMALAGRKSAVAREALLARIAASDGPAPSERDVRYAFLAARGLVTMAPADVASPSTRRSGGRCASAARRPSRSRTQPASPRRR